MEPRSERQRFHDPPLGRMKQRGRESFLIARRDELRTNQLLIFDSQRLSPQLIRLTLPLTAHVAQRPFARSFDGALPVVVS